MGKKEIIIPSLDLHGIKHNYVEILVENFILRNEYKLPIDIVTGHSEDMKKIVREVLEYYGFEYEDGDFFNKGYYPLAEWGTERGGTKCSVGFLCLHPAYRHLPRACAPDDFLFHYSI